MENLALEQKRPADVILLCADTETRDVLRFWLDGAGVPVAVADDGISARALLAEKERGGLIVDRFLPPWPGLDPIKALKRRHPALRVVVIGGGDSDNARLAREIGADTLLERPLRRAGVMRALDFGAEKTEP
ncbi:MAG: response regulator [Rhodospirillales bacterium]|nr:response regulator [Rhodospirillales bacterium]